MANDIGFGSRQAQMAYMAPERCCAVSRGGTPMLQLAPSQSDATRPPYPGAHDSNAEITQRAPGPVLGRLGGLSVRLATQAKDVAAAQRLRYRVFYEELSAIPSGGSRLARSDRDDFDPICDHLVVVDESAPGPREACPVVGTCRLLRQDVADRHCGFYSASEFEVGRLVEAHSPSRFLEVGRSCVLRPYRHGRTIELLWHGIWTYVLYHRIDAMVGCASLRGTEPIALALPLSFLHHFARAPRRWRVNAVPGRGVEMNLMPREAIEERAAVRSLPPMIKGYLRLGAGVGEHAVIDHQFGTTDVMIVLRTGTIAHRYVSRHSALDNRINSGGNHVR